MSTTTTMLSREEQARITVDARRLILEMESWEGGKLGLLFDDEFSQLSEIVGWLNLAVFDELIRRVNAADNATTPTAEELKLMSMSGLLDTI
jgi:hypothetical protein